MYMVALHRPQDDSMFVTLTGEYRYREEAKSEYVFNCFQENPPSPVH